MPCIGHIYNEVYSHNEFFEEKTKQEQLLTLGSQFTELHSAMNNILIQTIKLIVTLIYELILIMIKIMYKSQYFAYDNIIIFIHNGVY